MDHSSEYRRPSASTRSPWFRLFFAVGTILPYVGVVAASVFYDEMIRGASDLEHTFYRIAGAVFLLNIMGFGAIGHAPLIGIVWWLAPVPAWLVSFWIRAVLNEDVNRGRRRRLPFVGAFVGLCLAPVVPAVLVGASAAFNMMVVWYPAAIAGPAMGYALGCLASPHHDKSAA